MGTLNSLVILGIYHYGKFLEKTGTLFIRKGCSENLTSFGIQLISGRREIHKAWEDHDLPKPFPLQRFFSPKLLLIDEDTHPREFKKELRWNDLYYHMANGL